MKFNMASKKIIIIDIDGVLVSYPEHFENYVFDLLKIRYTLDEIKLLPQYQLLKYSFRVSNIKRTLPILNDNIPKIIDQLRKLYNVWIVTHRPIEMSGMDTIAWLDVNKIGYDEIFFVKNKICFMHAIKESILAIIDDEDNNLIPFKDSGIVMIHISGPADWMNI